MIFDWALISPDRRGHEVTTPSVSTLCISISDTNVEADTKIRKSPFVDAATPGLRLVNWDDQDLKGVTNVYKAGRSTGYTVGEYSHLNTVSYVATVFEKQQTKA